MVYTDIKGKPKYENILVNGNYMGNKGPLFGTRHLQILLMAFCILVGMAMRTSMSVAIVAMNDHSTSVNPNIPTYHWNNTSVILSSFFWTYIINQALAAPLEKRYGPKWFLLGAIFINSISFIMIPFAAENSGFVGVIVCRLFQGLGQGFMFPSSQVIMGLWVPSEERSRSGIVMNIGDSIGSALASLVTGYLSASWWGWPSAFYFFGSLGLVWCLLYLIFGQQSPARHPNITLEEQKYIQVSLNQEDDIVIPIPWKQLFTCMPFWAVLVAQIGMAWNFNFTITESSTYLAKVMSFDVESNGLYNAIPPVMGLVSALVFGPVSDFIVTNGYLSTVTSRRVFHLSGSFTVTICLISLSVLTKSQSSLSIVLLTIINVGYSAFICGSTVSMLDLSPRFAGVIFGISNAVSQMIALFAPLLVQFVVKDQTNASQWRIVFIITAAIMSVTAIFFSLCASGSRQPWDGPEEKTKLSEKIKRISVISF